MTGENTDQPGDPQQVPLVPMVGEVEVPDFLQPREIGPLWPERGRRRRGRWFLAVPVVLALLMVAVVLQAGSGDDPVRQAAPVLPAAAQPSPSGSASSAAASSASPSASASAAPSASSASRRPASPSASAKPSRSSARPTAHRGAVVGIGGRCLAVDRDRAELAVCDDRDSQRWSAPGDGTVRAMNRCLDVFAGGQANGTPVILYWCNRGDNQQWQLRGDGTWRNPRSNKCLSTVGGRSDPGTHLAVFDCAGAPHQRWTLT